MLSEILHNVISEGPEKEIGLFCKAFLNWLGNNTFTRFLSDSDKFDEAAAWQIVLNLAHNISTKKIQSGDVETEDEEPGQIVTPVADGVKSQSEIRDLRIMRLSVQNLKCFPPAISPAKEVHGITTCKSGTHHKPISGVFLGGNGVGKSSLFLGLELSVLPQSSILRRKGHITPEEQEEVLAHHGASAINSDKELKWRSYVTTYTEHLPSDKINTPLWPAFFYDDLDSHILGLQDCSEKYLAEQLGLYELMELLVLLKKISLALHEASDIERSGNSTRKIIPTPNSGAEKQEQKDTKKRLTNQFNARFPVKYGYIKKKLVGRDLIDSLIDQLEEERHKSLRKFDAIARPIFEALFESHLAHNDSSGREGVGQRPEADFKLDEKIVVDFTQSPPKVVIKVNDGDEMKPRAYFNTFRFKLYVVTLKIALACAAMRLRKVVFPIVLDDVFDSSDFHHRHDIREFMYRLTQAYSQLPKSEKYPFQLILFTQDEIIADSAWRGLVQGLGGDNVKYSRLFHYSEATDSDKSKITIENKDYTFVSLESRIR